MSNTRREQIRNSAMSELRRLAMDMDLEFGISASLPIEEIDAELRLMGCDPDQLAHLSPEPIVAHQPSVRSAAYAYISNELLAGEAPTFDVNLLMLKVRYLGGQRRYEEALEVARQITELAPNYWRGWISYSGAHVLLGNMPEGERILDRMLSDHSDNSKAVGAAIHGRANAMEIKCKLDPTPAERMKLIELYEESLKFDSSRTNTRACLIINSVLSGQIDKSQQIFEESIQHEGFFDDMALELRERGGRGYGAKMYQVLPAFPMWFRNLMDGSGPVPGGIADSASLA